MWISNIIKLTLWESLNRRFGNAAFFRVQSYTVKKFVKFARMPEFIIARVRATHVAAHVSARASEKRAIHAKLKSWLRPLGLTVPYLKINHISCFFRYSWLSRPAFKTATFRCSSVWFSWLKWAGTGRSFLPLMTSLRCSLNLSANLRPVSPI